MSGASSTDASDVRAILAQNEIRVKRLFAPYNPLTGEGSPIERVRLYFTPDSYVLIPAYMAATPTVAAIIAAGGVGCYATAEGIDLGTMYGTVHRLRAVYDFEFWCISCVKIFDKTSGRLVPFKLRRAQLKLVRILLCDLFTGKPVRIVLLKARQWGGSTVVQMFMAWIQLFHRSGWNSVIVADVEDQARTIRAMYSRMARRHPVEICSVQFCNFEGSSKIKCSSIGIVSSRSAPCRSLTASVRVI